MARVLVTGVSRDAGARTARALVAAGHQVFGVDAVPPSHELGDAKFVRADIRNPGIDRLLDSEAVEVIVHTGVVLTPWLAGGRSTMKEINVIGSMQLLAACQHAQSVKHVVLKSSAAVYGASGTDPAAFTESMQARELPGGGLGRDIVDIEAYARNLSHQRDDIQITVLRMANWMGPKIDSPITRYFKLSVIPAVLGFDPRVQFLHEHDGVAALVHAVATRKAGTFNVAGPGVIPLSAALRQLGKPIVRLPEFASVPTAALVRRLALLDVSPDQLPWLTYGRVLSLAAMREEFQFEPQYSTAAAFETFRQSLRPGVLAMLTSAGGTQ